MRWALFLLLVAGTLRADVEEWARTLQDESRSDEERSAALLHLYRSWADTSEANRENRMPALRAILRALPSAPPPITVSILQWMRTELRDPRLMRVLTHFVYPNHRGRTLAHVRVEGTRTLGKLCGPAALPTLFFCLDDPDEAVRAAVRDELAALCGNREDWRAYLHSDEAAENLERAFAALRMIWTLPHGKPTPDLSLAVHVAGLVADPELPLDTWKIAHRFLCDLIGRELGTNRDSAVKELRAWQLDDVLALLEKHEGILTERVPFAWISEGLEPFRKGLREIDKARALDPAKARARIEAADVVLVADLHQLDPHRIAFARTVEDFMGGRECALAFEAIPFPFEEHLAEARKGKELLAFLQKCWPWPVKAYEQILRRSKLEPLPVLAVGLLKPSAVPSAATPDRKREPAPTFDAMDMKDFKYGLSWSKRNMAAAARIAAWIAENPGKRKRKVFVLYGAAHYFGDTGIKRQLEQAKLDTVVLAPFLPAWEIALRKRFGPAAARTWYEVGPGILRPPYVSDGDIRSGLAVKEE